MPNDKNPVTIAFIVSGIVLALAAVAVWIR